MTAMTASADSVACDDGGARVGTAATVCRDGGGKGMRVRRAAAVD